MEEIDRRAWPQNCGCTVGHSVEGCNCLDDEKVKETKGMHASRKNGCCGDTSYKGALEELVEATNDYKRSYREMGDLITDRDLLRQAGRRLDLAWETARRLVL
jgi:hypothetical protein